MVLDKIKHFGDKNLFFLGRLSFSSEVEQKLMLSSSFSFDESHFCQIYDFRHISVLLKSDLYVEQNEANVLNKKLMLSSSFGCEQNHYSRI
jgi:hypothetical protein